MKLNLYYHPDGSCHPSVFASSSYVSPDPPRPRKKKGEAGMGWDEALHAVALFLFAPAAVLPYTPPMFHGLPATEDGFALRLAIHLTHRHDYRGRYAFDVVDFERQTRWEALTPSEALATVACITMPPSWRDAGRPAWPGAAL